MQIQPGAEMNTAAGGTTQGKARCFLLTMSLLLAGPAFAQISDPSSQTRPAARLVLISIPDRRLAVISDGNVIANFAIAVGAAETPSPTGQFRIVNRVSDPTYYRPGTVIPSGKDNPLGTRWVGLSQKGYGIHGTNVPRSIGRAASHGCFRLKNRDMERLFSMLQVGDLVEIHGERDELVTEIFGTGAQQTLVADAQVPAQAGGQ